MHCYPSTPEQFSLVGSKKMLKMKCHCTLVAKCKATPMTLDSFIMVSLGLISIGPLEPTICKEHNDENIITLQHVDKQL